MALEEHALRPVHSDVTAGRHKERSKTIQMGTSFDGQMAERKFHRRYVLWPTAP